MMNFQLFLLFRLLSSNLLIGYIALIKVNSCLQPLLVTLSSFSDQIAGDFQLFIPQINIKLQSRSDFFQANWTQVDWSLLSFLVVHAPVHAAVEVDAMRHSEQVSDFMRNYFANTLKLLGLPVTF